jgi:hypothetical protein
MRGISTTFTEESGIFCSRTHMPLGWSKAGPSPSFSWSLDPSPAEASYSCNPAVSFTSVKIWERAHLGNPEWENQSQYCVLWTKTEETLPGAPAFQRKYHSWNKHKTFRSWKGTSILLLVLARKKKDIMYPKFQRNITPTKKPLSLFQVLSAVQHYRTKFIRNANELFDLVFSWQLTFIFTQSQIYTNLSDTIKSDFIYQTLKSFILGFSNLRKSLNLLFLQTHHHLLLYPPPLIYKKTAC